MTEEMTTEEERIEAIKTIEWEIDCARNTPEDYGVYE